jgi:hypothetical protein
LISYFPLYNTVRAYIITLSMPSHFPNHPLIASTNYS